MLREGRVQGGGVLVSGGGDRLIKAWSPLTGEDLLTVLSAPAKT